MRLPLFIAVASLCCASVLANDLPKHNCTAPDLPSPPLTEKVAKEVDANVAAHKACVKKFVDEQAALSRRHTDAGNAAIAEYNAFSEKVNALAKASKEAAEKK